MFINWVLNGYLDFGISGFRCDFSRISIPKTQFDLKHGQKMPPQKSKEKKNDRKDNNDKKSLLGRIVKPLRSMINLR